MCVSVSVHPTLRPSSSQKYTSKLPLGWQMLALCDFIFWGKKHILSDKKLPFRVNWNYPVASEDFSWQAGGTT